MKRLTAIGFVVVLLLLVGGVAVVWRWPGVTGAANAPGNSPRPPGKSAPPTPATQSANPAPAPATSLSPAEKAARVERIKHDYDEVRTKTAADYAAAGTAFPGGLPAFLRQLALLERELHNDYAAVLSPRELEDLEMRDTNAGQQVKQLLGETAATEDQRRAAFRLQREFDDQFALSSGCSGNSTTSSR